MEDQFEKYVRDHSDEFDSFELPEDSWANIQKMRGDEEGRSEKKSSKPKVVFITALRRVAAVLVLGLAGYGLFSIVSGPSNPVVESQLPAEIQEMDEYYEAQIAQSWEELNRQHPNNELVSQEVSTEMELLGEEKEKLMDELKQNFSNQKVLEELIEIYKMRLEILEEVLETLNEENERNYDSQNNFNT